MVEIRHLPTGVELCLKNARKFIEDAELLFEHESYGHATSLVYLGLEELAKALRFSEANFFGKELEDKNDVFRYHKTKMALLTGFISAPAISEAFEIYEKERSLTDETIQQFVRATELELQLMKKIQEIDKKRKAGFYVDYRNDKWHSPFDIRREQAKSLVDFGKQYLAEISLRCKILMQGQVEDLKTALKKAVETEKISQAQYEAMSSMLDSIKNEGRG